MFSRVQDIQAGKLEVLQCVSHRWCHFGGAGSFDFESETLAPANDEQIQFRAAVGRPKIALLITDLQMASQLIDHKAFPGCA